MSATQRAKLEPPSRVEVYTDGGCKPNPGPGGWGAVVRAGRGEWLLSGNDPQTTNNQMELQAAVSSLAMLEGIFGPCSVELYTDSEYLRQGITSWIEDWERNGWRTKAKAPVKNQALWRALRGLTRIHEISWHWLPGHAGHRHNERADRLATQARKALRPSRPPTTAAKPEQGPPEVEIYVKASCDRRRKVGGWGVVICKGGNTRALSGRAKTASANALLIQGAAEGLRALTRPCSVVVYSDADYLIQGASKWIEGWLARDWRTKGGKPVANRHEWEALLAAADPHHVSWRSARVGDTPHMARAAALAAGAEE